MNALQKMVASPAQNSRIVDGINALSVEELARMAGWGTIDSFSPGSEFDGIDADPNSVVLDGNGAFEAQAYIYLTVPGASADERMGEEYAATITGVVVEDKVRIEKAEVDTAGLGF